MIASLDEQEIELLKAEQTLRARKVIRTDRPKISGPIVTGIDVAYLGQRASACAVIYDTTVNEICVTKTGEYVVDAPYIPSFFQLREGPILIDMLKDLRGIDPVLIDANGILHPRRFGLASFVGVELDIRTIGVAKKLLLGKVGERNKNVADVTVNNEIVGRAIWLEGRSRPIYVSIGHRVTLETAVRIVKMCERHGQIYPLQQAHICARKQIKK